ncbi:hypothetical protein BXZ70DRAFT_359462 [Cristinia sonorae]|uniref:Uncharacterized protein n=1 Tax=Cristinia sonorae TaxID=1940300 RepID=A0A8K0XNA6_9AGAR|nr:hypothetical protein BXZ70DRAFT_359462 [Cristinia sonorae]
MVLTLGMAVIVPSVSQNHQLTPDLVLFPVQQHSVDLSRALVAAPATDTAHYRLVNPKRKTDDDADDLPYGHIPKRAKQDDIEQNDYVQPTPSQEQLFNVTVEEALAAILSLPPFQAHVQDPFLPPTDLQPALPGAAPSLLPPEDPVAINDNSIFFGAPAPEIADDQDDNSQYVQFRHTPRRENRCRPRAPPLWKVACRQRVDHIASIYSMQAIRDSVYRKYGFPELIDRSGMFPNPPLMTSRALELEIFTPRDFDNSPLDLSADEASARTPPTVELGPEDHLLDSSFVDSDTDSDEELEEEMDVDAEGESDSDYEDEPTSPHESLLDFPAPPFAVPSMNDVVFGQAPLPSMNAIPAYCLRGYGGVESECKGTPSAAPAEACGTLAQLRANRQLAWEQRMLRQQVA